MKIFRENLYFATMGAERQGRLIAYRSNEGKLNIGDNVFDLLCLSDTERSYLLRELFSGGEMPIVIMAGENAIIVDRHLLYSTGVCCFVKPEFSADVICSMLYRETFGMCIMSPFAVECAINAEIQDEDIQTQAYISLSRYKSGFSVFSDRVEEYNPLEVASRVCDEMGCALVSGVDLYGVMRNRRDGVIYSNSLYALSVLTAAFVSKIISGERAVYIDCADGEHISISIGCESLPQNVRDVFSYICAVARDKDAEMSFSLSDGKLALDVCPFYADVGLMGVKNPQQLKQD